MSSSVTAPPGGIMFAHPRRLLVAMHVPFIAFSALQVLTGFGIFSSDHGWAGLPLVLLAGAIQLRHSIAAAEGRRPRHWVWTLIILLVIAHLPEPVFKERWNSMHWYVIASCGMLLPGRTALLLALASMVAGFVELVATSTFVQTDPASLASTFAYLMTVLFLGGAGLYGAARLVRLTEEVQEARAGLVEIAIGRERIRISRDVHDLLGHSLSAVSLKGDLAIRLLERQDVPRARAEVESLVSVARTALHDLLHIPHSAPPISWSAEVERAADLLAAAGIEPRIRISTVGLAPPLNDLFAWAVREGVTNVLRHSAATICSINLRQIGGDVRLEIENDGAAAAASVEGHGLSGLAARAAARSGTAHGAAIGDDRFRLVVEAPGEAT